MSDKDILQRAIQKAIDGGWLPYFSKFAPMTKRNIITRINEESLDVNFDYVMTGHIIGVGGFDIEPFEMSQEIQPIAKAGDMKMYPCIKCGEPTNFKHNGEPMCQEESTTGYVKVVIKD